MRQRVGKKRAGRKGPAGEDHSRGITVGVAGGAGGGRITAGHQQGS